MSQVAAQKAEQMNTDPVKIDVRQGVGSLSLNRESVLNSLNFEMAVMLYDILNQWREAPAVRLILVEGIGRAFCAGGDIRSYYENKKLGQFEQIDRFFTQEYTLNALIKEYQKPYIPLVNGICMGGGMGLSMHSPFMVVTEKALLAMPEATIGFFTDVGATYALSRLPHSMGLYLGLTSTRISGAEAYHLGLSQYYILSHRLEKLKESLHAHVFSDADAVHKILQEFTTIPERSELITQMPLIESLFSADSVEAILKNLEKSDHSMAKTILESFTDKSPLSLKIIFDSLKRAQHLDFKDCMKMERLLAYHFSRDHDFAEGIRALIIDKDKTPRWKPGSLAEVSVEKIESYFSD